MKKPKSASSGKAASYTSSPSHSDVKHTGDSYSETVNGSDSVSGAYVNAANGLAAGSTLPHFSQVWSSTAQDVVYNADQLLAQMTGPAGNGQTGLYHGNSTATADAAVLLAADASQHLQPAVYQYVSCCLLFFLFQSMKHVMSRNHSFLWKMLPNFCKIPWLTAENCQSSAADRSLRSLG